jgi:dolichol-phosphate mannosyltransferase
LASELTIVIPTYNEKDNIPTLVRALDSALNGINWEAIFVDDDSPDGTWEVVNLMARSNPAIRGIRRLGRTGLSSACVEGVLATSAPYICIMDADLQHDETIIPGMLNAMQQEGLDLVIGSRYVDAGSTGELSARRVRMSRVATRVAGLLLKHPVKDPMSGFFMFRRTYFEMILRRLSAKGFKILLDMLVSSPAELKYRELPYRMRQRNQGESKLGTRVIWEFFLLFADKLAGRLLPLRFIAFATVGVSGIFVHLSVLWALNQLWGTDFIHAQALATIVAMTSNFILNNHYTYSDRKLTGVDFIYGLLSFYLACALGAVINVAFASWLFGLKFSWWFSGLLGALAGAVWNYAVTAIFTWRDFRNNPG